MKTGEELTPIYESIIELKVFWKSDGLAFARREVRKDLTKLARAIRDGSTRSAFLVILDNLDRDGIPYLSSKEISALKHEIKGANKVGIFHWPDGSKPTENIRDFKVRNY